MAQLQLAVPLDPVAMAVVLLFQGLQSHMPAAAAAVLMIEAPYLLEHQEARVVAARVVMAQVGGPRALLAQPTLAAAVAVALTTQQQPLLVMVVVEVLAWSFFAIQVPTQFQTLVAA
jgi:hypothetical protein